MRIKKLIFTLFGLTFVVAALAAGWVYLDYQAFLERPLQVPAEGASLQVEPGTSMGRLAAELAERGMLKRPEYLRFLARSEGLGQKIKAGEYEVPAGLKPRAFLQLLVEGKVKLYSLTLVEGWNFRQVMAAVRQHPALKQTLSGADDAEIMRRIGQPDQHPEGWFFPDTYNFPRGLTDVEFLKRAHQTMRRELEAAWQGREKDLPLKNAYEALILASIIEKETAHPEEYGKIAGVFVRRLRKGMLLQTDPTVIYGMGENYDGNIRRKDLRTDTPYNTYTRAGLTPTPIAMPGRKSLQAAVHPTPGKSLYFVARCGGSHHFSATLAEHNRAVVKYQIRRRSNCGS